MKTVFFIFCMLLSITSVALPHQWPFVFAYLALPQLLLLYSFIALIFFWHKPFISVVFLPAICVGLLNILQVYSLHNADTPENEKSFSVLSLNLWKYNENPYKSVDAVANLNADILVLQEVDQDSWGSLEAIIVDSYPNRKRAWNGVVIASHYEMYNCIEAHQAFPETFTEAAGFLHCTVLINKQPINLIAIHTNSSRSDEDIAKRHRQFKDLYRYIKAVEGKLIVAGDFNTPFWDEQMIHFIKQANLDLPKISWFHGSWPTWLPGFIRTRFDYIFSRNILLKSFETLKSTGSDHAPVRAVF